MKEFPARMMSRRMFLYLTVLGPVGFGVATTLGCKNEQPQIVNENQQTVTEGLIETESFDYWFADQLLKITNEERIERDLVPFIQHSGLIKAAKEHAQEMAQNNFVDHQSLDDSTHVDRLIATGFGPNLLFDENIIRGKTGRSAIDEPSKYHEDFMNSNEGHRENILEPRFRLVGIGCYVKNSTRWCVVDFVGVP